MVKTPQLGAHNSNHWIHTKSCTDRVGHFVQQGGAPDAVRRFSRLAQTSSCSLTSGWAERAILSLFGQG